MSATSAPPIRARLFAMAAGFLAVLLSSTASATSFGEIMGWCSNRGDEGDQRLCIAYVSAALELMRSPDPVSNGGHHVCVPDTDVGTIVIPLLTTWMKQNPQAADQAALPTAGAVLASRYPCS
jgi:hypothetical protein